MADDAQLNDIQEGDGMLTLDELMTSFNLQFERPAMGMFSMMAAQTQSLNRVYIPGLIVPVQTPGADVGINFNMVNAHANGLLIIVQPYPGMTEGDWIEVFWGSSPAAAASDVVKPGQIGQNFAMYVAASKVPGYVPPATQPTPGQVAGVVADLWFRVTRANSGNQEESPRLAVLSRMVFPGGSDPEPDRPGHDNLLKPVPSLPSSGVIGEPEAQAGVPVTIPAYPNMRGYDRIRLSWGGEFVSYEVQPDEVGAAVVITVPEAVIKGAGDSESLVVTYRVLDEVHNQSSDWSLRGFVHVEVGGGSIPAPLIVNPADQAGPEDVIDLGKLGNYDLEIKVEVPRKNSPLLLEDEIHVTWVGTTAAGQAISYKPSMQKVVRLGLMLTFLVPNDRLQSLGGGRGVASYVVKRKNPLSNPNSNRAFVSFVGQARLLLAPVLLEAQDGLIEAGAPKATVQIPATAGLLQGDRIKLSWLGTRADTSPVLYTVERSVTASQVGKVINFPIDTARYLAPLDGGSLELRYQIVRRDLEVPLDSESTVIGVGEEQSELPAPSTDPLVPDGVIKPDEHLEGINVVVPIYSNMEKTQTIHLFWEGEVGGSFTDYVDAYPKSDTYFTIDHAQLVKNKNGKVRVYYIVSEPGRPDRVSDDLVLTIGVGQSQQLPQPLVLEALEGILDPANASRGATVRIPASAALKVGDEVVLYWVGDKPGSVAEKSEFVIAGQEGLAKDLVIPFNVVDASNNGNVVVHYEVYRAATGNPDTSIALSLRVQGAALPLPTFVEAVNGNLNPDDVRNGATVLVEAAARLRAGDVVTANLRAPSGIGQYPRTVQASEAGQALRVIIPYADVLTVVGSTVELFYTIKRSPNGPTEQSLPKIYTVNRVIGAGTLRIFGARYNATTYRASSSSRVISAFSTSDLKPILAEWQYQGDSTWKAGYTWLDKQPWRLLRVRSTSDAVVLNPSNVIGSGNDAAVNGTAAYTAMIENQPVTPGRYSLVSWGNAAYGGGGPGIVYNDVIEVTSTRSAYAARLASGLVVCWGNTAEGGTLRAEDVGQPFLDIRSNSTAFIGRRQVAPGSKLGRLTGWGVLSNGADIPQSIRALTDIVEVYGGGLAFAAKRSNGSLVAWGQAANGGNVPAEIANRTDNIYVKGNYAAFAVRRNDNTVEAWGSATYGGSVPAQIKSRKDIATLEAATAQAFSLITTNGQVLTWGAVSHGGSVPGNIAALSDIVEVTSTWHAFCARRRSGHVVAWGNATNGGTVPSNIQQLNDIVQVTGSAWSFAALRSNGTVVAWGAPASGGDISAVQSQLNRVRAIYANSNGFTALTSDGRVVTWGNAAGGGNSSAAQGLLRGRLLTGHTDTTAGAVVAADNELRGLA